MTCECYQVLCPLHPQDEPFCQLNPCRHPVAVWPDGTECELEEIGEMTHLSDDYRIVFKDDFPTYEESWEISSQWPDDLNIALGVQNENV